MQAWAKAGKKQRSILAAMVRGVNVIVSITEGLDASEEASEFAKIE